MQTQRAVNEMGSSQPHQEALIQKHTALSCEIEAARKQPATTDFYLSQLKKQKLVLKEEIEGIRARKTG